MNGPFEHNQSLTLQRDCNAVLIPDGDRIIIPEGTEVFLTQALGGSATVNIGGNLARIAGQDLDAVGMPTQVLPAQEAEIPADGSVNEEALAAQLRTCYDPEIPIDIVELGLIYQCMITTLDGGGNRVDIVMTLTAPGCGMGPFLVEDVREKALLVPNVTEVNVDVVFDPPWNPSMMSEAARLQTGLY